MKMKAEIKVMLLQVKGPRNTDDHQQHQQPGEGALIDHVCHQKESTLLMDDQVTP